MSIFWSTFKEKAEEECIKKEQEESTNDNDDILPQKPPQ